MTSKPILFCDFDGVLSHDRYWRSLPAKQLKKVQEFIFYGDGIIVGEWMRGKRTAEEVNQIVADYINMPYPELWDVFVNDCKTMRVSKDNLERLSSLRGKYTVILITTNMDSFSRFTSASHGLNQYFDYIFNSYDEGMLKTDNDGEPYATIAKRYNVPMSECSVFDDSKSVCEIFSALGGTAYLVSGENPLEVHLSKFL